MLFAILLSIVGALLVIQYLKQIWTTRYIEHIAPCLPKSLWPILGHIPMLCGLDPEGIFNVMDSAFRQVDRLGRVMIGPLPVILVNHPKTMETVMTSEHMLSKPFLYDFIEVGDGLFGMRDGKKWSKIRKLLNRTLNPTILKSFLPIMDSKAKTMVERLRPLVSSENKTDSGINILPYFADCTLDMIFNTTMGYNEGNVPGKSEYLHKVEKVLKIVCERMVNVHHYVEIFFKMTEAYRVKEDNRQWVNNFVEKIVKHRRQQLTEVQKQAPEEDEFRIRSMIFLDQLLAFREGKMAVNFTDQDIVAQILTMMFAGSDTTTFAMSTVCLFLAMHPEIQEKVVTEMNAVFSTDSVEITQDTLQQLKYTEQVIKETLRLAPSAFLMGRETSAEVTIAGVRIPPGQFIMYNLYAYHRRKDIWGPDADQFNPDRFKPEQEEKRHRFAFLPFLAGQRICIGHRYAMLSMKIVLLRVLQEYRMWTNMKLSDMRFEFKVSLHLIGPHLVWLSKRKK